MTYSNIEQEAINLLKFTLGAHLVRRADAYRSSPRGTWAQANTDALLRSDTTSRYQAHEIGIRAGFLTTNEARALEDLPPLEDSASAQPDDEYPYDEEEFQPVQPSWLHRGS